MVRVRFAILSLIALCAAAAPARAQQIALSASTTPSAQSLVAQTPAGPSMTSQRSAAHLAESHGALAMMPADRAGLGQARAMMIVGVAGLLAGGIIGGTPGTIIMVGGGVVGLVGLYEYLQ